jgi:tRNA(Ile)-lysidine synthase
MSELVAITRRAILGQRLLTPGDTVVVAVSGGADSVALLDVLTQLAPDLAITLHVAHLDHLLREESAADAQFVADLAQRLGIGYTVGQADVRTLAQQGGLSLEEAARQARYRFLGEVAQTVDASRIVTAHHASDQAETMLLHLLRGTGLTGLRGILPSAPLPGLANEAVDTAPRVIRPWLEVPRDAILAYVAERGLDYRDDPTNQDTRLTRNRIRYELLPLLQTYNPAIIETLGRMARTLADDDNALDDLVSAAWLGVARETEQATELELAALTVQPIAVQRRLVRRAVAFIGGLRDVSAAHIEAILRLAGGEPGERVDLPAGVTVSRDYASLIFGHGLPPLPDWPLLDSGADLSVVVPGVTALPGGRWSLVVTATEVAASGTKPDEAGSTSSLAGLSQLPLVAAEFIRQPWSATIDAAAAEGGLWLRTRRRGERFQPLGLDGHHQSLHDFMNSAKIPREARDRLPLLVNGDGIVWVCGFRLDHRARVTPATRDTLHLTFTKM